MAIGLKTTLDKWKALPEVEHLAILIALGVILLVIGEVHGRWVKAKECEGMGATEARQVKGDLTAKEIELEAAKLDVGKVQTELKESKDIAEGLKASNADLSKISADIAAAHNLDLKQLAQLRAAFEARRTDGSAGLAVGAAGSGSECGACAGEVRFGKPPYATCSWTDYAALKASGRGGALDLKLGVRIDQVTLRQKPKEGTLEAVIDKVYLLDAAGNQLAEGKLDESSRVFTAPVGRGDLMRRHIYGYGGADMNRLRAGFLTQKGVRPFIWGGGVTRDWSSGKLGPEIILGFQVW